MLGVRVVNYKSATMRVPGAIRRAFLYVVFSHRPAVGSGQFG
jgi:hypothetical protein